MRALVLTLSLVLGCSFSFAANSDLRINEVLLINEQGIVDEYGHHVPWIEFHNPSAATINLGGMYLTDDPTQPTKYPIRSGHRGTIIPPYQSIILYLDGKPELGTFHNAMLLDPTKEQTIYLFDGDGKHLIDKVTIPAYIPSDQSYARLDDAGAEWGIVAIPTPKDLNNSVDLTSHRLEEFKQNDPFGLVMTLIAMLVVFLALAILYLAFKWLGHANVRSEARKAAKVAGVSEEVAEERLDVPAGVYVAIAMALYESSQNLHDEESGIISIETTQRRYSPWSSKIHTLRRVPEVRHRK